MLHFLFGSTSNEHSVIDQPSDNRKLNCTKKNRRIIIIILQYLGK